jgi:hypothetical protein
LCSETVSDADMLSGSHRDRYHRHLGAFLHVLASPVDEDTKLNEPTTKTKEISKKTLRHNEKSTQPSFQTSGSLSTALNQVQFTSQTPCEASFITAMHEHSAALEKHAAALHRHKAVLKKQARESDHT